MAITLTTWKLYNLKYSGYNEIQADGQLNLVNNQWKLLIEASIFEDDTPIISIFIFIAANWTIN